MAGMGGIILYIIFLGALVYFMAIRPQKKERQKQQELLASVAVGDTILTSSGFYGVIIDMTDDSDRRVWQQKNCRTPMQKVAIVQVEKPETINVTEGKPGRIPLRK
ncbi:MAG: preprotein translocase subunit YajC [Clostridium sp.]